jgi:hypothetical protein
MTSRAAATARRRELIDDKICNSAFPAPVLLNGAQREA